MGQFGGRLRDARERAKLSLGQVYEYEGIHKGHLSEMERDLKEPTASTIAKLAIRYGCTADYLLSLTDDPQGYPPPAPLPNMGQELLAVLVSLNAQRRLELLGHAQVIWDAQQRAENAAQLSQMLDQVQAFGGDEAMEAVLAILEMADTDEAAAVAMLNRFVASRTGRRRRRPNGAQKGGEQVESPGLP